MADEEQVKILKEGVGAWNKWRKENPETQPDLSNANLIDTSLSGANLSGAYLNRAFLRDSDLRGAVLSEAYLKGTDFKRADLSEADLCQADLSEAELRWAKLIEANLSGAKLTGADFRTADLRQANLSEAKLSDAKLSEAKLNGTKLIRANLSGANLIGASLIGANLTEANLNEADLCQADLRNICLVEAELTGAQLTTASLTGANFSNARVFRTTFVDVDLSQVKGLETVRHHGPSEISISTIYRSQGKIPFEFLRGAGIPDNFIEYMHSLVGTTFEFYSCFISYSSKDQPFAERIHADLQDNGVRCWFAPHHGQGGQKLHEQIDQAIRVHEKLLLILSADSMKSEWVKTEIKKAAKRQIGKKKDVLFPVSLVPFNRLRKWECFDSDLGKDLGAEIREYLIPDFSRWKDHDSYQKAFAKLLRDLRSGKTKTA